MFKVEIEFDEKKVLKENKYNLDKMYEIVDEEFTNRNLIKTDKGTYVSNDNESDYGNMWAAILIFLQTKWFMKNANKLFWYNDSEGRTHIEDVLKGCKERRFGALYE